MRDVKEMRRKNASVTLILRVSAILLILMTLCGTAVALADRNESAAPDDRVPEEVPEPTSVLIVLLHPIAMAVFLFVWRKSGEEEAEEKKR